MPIETLKIQQPSREEARERTLSRHSTQVPDTCPETRINILRLANVSVEFEGLEQKRKKKKMGDLKETGLPTSNLFDVLSQASYLSRYACVCY